MPYRLLDTVSRHGSAERSTLSLHGANLNAFKTSMMQDLESKRPLEIDALLASVIEIGALVGVPTPYCDTVLGLIRQRAANLGLYRYALPRR